MRRNEYEGERECKECQHKQLVLGVLPHELMPKSEHAPSCILPNDDDDYDSDDYYEGVYVGDLFDK